MEVKGYYSKYELQGVETVVRVDLNVQLELDPNTGKYVVKDDEKLKAILPGTRELMKEGAKIVLMSHLGRYKDIKKAKDKEAFSLKPVAEMLSRYLKVEVKLARDVSHARKLEKSMKNGDVILLENLRVMPGEEKNNYNYARSLASLGKVYINNAFASSHRKHSSTYTIARFMEKVILGDLVIKESEILDEVLNSTASPKVAVLGGAKVSDKLGVIKNLMKKMNIILIGGAMANTFLKASKKEIGMSLCENDMLNEASDILKNGNKLDVEIVLPIDVVIAWEISDKAKTKVVGVDKVPKDAIIFDIGPKTRRLFAEKIKNAKVIMWNGPMGYFEKRPFARGTTAIAKAIAANSEAFSVAGGGETVQAAKRYGKRRKIKLLTGGGASLEYLRGLKLPGITACKERVA